MILTDLDIVFRPRFVKFVSGFAAQSADSIEFARRLEPDGRRPGRANQIHRLVGQLANNAQKRKSHFKVNLRQIKVFKVKIVVTVVERVRQRRKVTSANGQTQQSVKSATRTKPRVHGVQTRLIGQGEEVEQRRARQSTTESAHRLTLV